MEKASRLMPTLCPTRFMWDNYSLFPICLYRSIEIDSLWVSTLWKLYFFSGYPFLFVASFLDGQSSLRLSR